MSRLIDCCPSSDDEQSRLDVTSSHNGQKKSAAAFSPRKSLVPKTMATASTRKVRRLGANSTPATNPLFLPWNAQNGNDNHGASREPQARSPTRPRRSLAALRSSRLEDSEDEQDSPPPFARSRRTRATGVVPSYYDDESEVSADEERANSPATEPTTALSPVSFGVMPRNNSKTVPGHASGTDRDPIIEVRMKADATHDDESTVYHTASEGSSESNDDSASEFEAFDSSDDSFVVPGKPHVQRVQRPPRHADNKDLLKKTTRTREASAKEVYIKPGTLYQASGLGEALDKFQIDAKNDAKSFPSNKIDSARGDGLSTPGTPPQPANTNGLVSPRKVARIPKTPYRPSVDAFWSQDFIDDWNDAHSPVKPILQLISEPNAKVSLTKASPTKASKRTFDAQKHSVAESFLRELDKEITEGQISELAESTGGVKLVWTKALNTTAGRANWRRETTRTKAASGETVSVSHKHHASIELAEKVIDTEDKLLNVLAHEFCHLANFMVSGVTNNPHGKEFKMWAAKCSHAFGESRGIHVTTKHTYEIDFRYIWECTECRAEYKRHSKSIDPQRHRCGSCKSSLKQIKPKPRGVGNATGGKSSKPSAYQIFVKEHMKKVREENPGSPHKDVMRIVADRWAMAKRGLSDVPKLDKVEAAIEQMALVTLDD
ncbi:hypothetical protein HIM_04274 [Hirsutella minnesotensis 3608]|uniref:SprT-like domain-containing protein n=1 Tax=Hirsutella minnesotensis 3608 TaxID=1043627 RepID=A0A0F8A1G6_9HYPO|nr:hypothetical protein HIM_04274 [Hirsutella minnesotensis 3608]